MYPNKSGRPGWVKTVTPESRCAPERFNGRIDVFKVMRLSGYRRGALDPGRGGARNMVAVGFSCGSLQLVVICGGFCPFINLRKLCKTQRHHFVVVVFYSNEGRRKSGALLKFAPIVMKAKRATLRYFVCPIPSDCEQAPFPA